MIYRRNTSAAGFTQIQNDILESPLLSAKAKGLLCYLLSKPKNWKVNINDLIARNADGRDGIIAGIDELVKQRYVTKKVFRVGGRFESEYDVYDFPQPKDQTGKTVTEKPLRKNRNGKTVTEEPERKNHYGETVTENPVDSNTNFSNTNFSNTNLNNTESNNTEETNDAEKTAPDMGLNDSAKDKKNNATRSKKNKAAAAQTLPALPEDLTALIDQIRAEMKTAKTPKEKEQLAADLAKLKAQFPVMYPFETPEFIEAWNDWKIHYAKKVRNKGGAVYNTNIAEQQSLNKLNTLAAGIQENAIELIYHAIEKNWQGFYPINDNNKQSYAGTQQTAATDGADFAGFGRALI